MRIINMVTLAQIISWGIFIFGDYLSETYSNDGLLGVTLFFLPIIMPVAYLIFRKKIDYASIPKWVNTLTALGVWSIENVIFLRLLGLLDIVPQSHENWEDMFNGIEYGIFSFLNVIAAPLVIICWKLLLFVNEKLKHSND